MHKAYHLVSLLLLAGLVSGCNTSGGDEGRTGGGDGDTLIGDGGDGGDGGTGDGDAGDGDDGIGGGDDDIDVGGGGSGEVHEIQITSPIDDAIVDTGDGLYARRVTVTVSNADGNPVPDGTRVRVGVIDSVFSYGIAETVEGDNQLQATESFHGDSLTNELERQLRPLDASDALVLLRNAEFDDRRRDVDTLTGPSSLTVDAPYGSSEGGLQYWMGISAKGTAVVDDDETAVSDEDGLVLQTENGKVTYQVRYPTRDDGRPLLGWGCGDYVDGRYTVEDPRGTPEGRPDEDLFSAQVLLHTEVLDNLQDGFSRYGTVSRSFCYVGIAGGEIRLLDGVSDDLTLDRGADELLEVELVDGGDAVPYAHTGFSATIRGDATGVTAEVLNGGRTNAEGVGQVLVSASGDAQGDGDVVIFSRNVDVGTEEVSFEVAE